MKQITIKLLITTILSLVIFFTLLNEANTQIFYQASDHNLKENQINIFTEEELSDTILINKLNNEKEENTKEDIVYYDIPLSEELQQYTWEMSERYDLDYKIVLSVMHTESRFKSDIVSYNGTSLGIMQINQFDTLNWLISETGIENANPFNPYHSIHMGTWYLNFLKSYWLKQGLSEENAMKAGLTSYYRGLNGAKRYMQKNGYHGEYVTKVYNYKNKLNDLERS